MTRSDALSSTSVEQTHHEDVNSGFVQELLADYLNAPESVDPEWRSYFESHPEVLIEHSPLLERLRARGLFANGQGNGAAVEARAEAVPATPTASIQPLLPVPAPPMAPAEPDRTLLGAVAAAMALVKAHRMHGHLAARLDPLGSEPPGDPALDPDRLEPRLTPELQARVPAGILRTYVPGETLADILPRLRETYCGTMAYEIEHISNHEQRVWLRRAIESRTYRGALPLGRRVALLERLSQVEGFERYLHRAFLGQKQFSLEGLDVMVPMLEEAIELAAAAGAREVHIGMAHRGRLNVLAHIIDRPYGELLREFEGEKMFEAVTSDPEGGSGDVKYHLGAMAQRATSAGEIKVNLAPNPSHLEYINPVVEGKTRADQTDRSGGAGTHDPKAALALLIHGDAAFPGQGVVAETLNLQALHGYATGGTLHLIANNQVGFTTDPDEGRSTRYSSDLAKGFDAPIVHVNADDPDAAISAIRLAMAFRDRFGHDAVVDLVGYRRYGHNEGDEPAYTQPLMAEAIAAHPSVFELYAERLQRVGVVGATEIEDMVESAQASMRSAHDVLKEEIAAGRSQERREDRLVRGATTEIETAVPVETLRKLNDQLLVVPAGFTTHPKLHQQLERRRDALGEEGGIDWAQAEALAFASLLREGKPVRLTGQDTERGTFSHRHLVLHDAKTGETWAPIQHLPEATASFEVYNSPLSETAPLGFEFGYAVAAPEALVLWEAQFGDFVNSAQVIVDQFIVSGHSKWHKTSRLTLLLPHGYEGNGPEHSSARMERFLQLSAQENIRLVNCSTAAQYFHVLRRQAQHPVSRPLVIMTPKGLLRLRQATSTLGELADGSFRLLIDDPSLDDEGRHRASRLVLCSGKLYYDIVGHERHAETNGLAVARLEQLYPFPVAAYADLLARYPNLSEVVWAQEEPQNMGGWRAIRHRLEESLPSGVRLRFVGRPWRASTSEGYPTAHLREQDRIVREALAVPTA